MDLEDTLVLVTADHSHVMTINGYPERGNDILGESVGSGEGRLEKSLLRQICYCFSKLFRMFYNVFFLLGMTGDISKIDNMPYTTLMFTNGPGFNYTTDGSRVRSGFTFWRQFKAEI